jgi:hypothetical protein
MYRFGLYERGCTAIDSSRAQKTGNVDPQLKFQAFENGGGEIICYFEQQIQAEACKICI